MFQREQAYADRREAGKDLGRILHRHLEGDDRQRAIVLALPRGGVPVAYEVAQALGAPLDVFLVRKLGTPGHRELAMGAIASGGIRVINDDVVRYLNVTPGQIEEIARDEERELARREAMYRQGPAPPLSDRVVVLVDDGLATGSTMRAAVQAVKQQRPARVIVAVPVGAQDTCSELRAIADEVVCARTPAPFNAVGQWYVDFDQTTDDEVRQLLSARTGSDAGPHHPA
jgi:predicted phosphoribosyltransferase